MYNTHVQPIPSPHPQRPRWKSPFPRRSPFLWAVNKLCIFVGTLVGGYVGGFLGSSFGIMTEIVTSGIGSLVGVYLGWKLAQRIER